jgi:cell division protein FtsN
MAAPRKGKGRQAVRNSSGGFPAWGWAVVGILVGVVLMATLSHRSLLPMNAPGGPQPNPQATAQRGSEPGVADSTENADKPKKPQYDFYSALTEKDVRIPDAEISAQARAEQKAANQPAAGATPPQAAAQQASQRPPAAVTQTVTAAPAAAVPPPSSGGGYLLQVGAFPSAAAADTLKAKLAMLGFVANVRQDNINGESVNRVRLGPYRSASELESVKQRLSSAGIPAIALKEGR